MSNFEIKTFDLEEIDVRPEKSIYPFEDLEVGQGFTVEKPVSSISSRVAQANKRSEKTFVSRTAKESTKEKPLTNVIRVK